MSGPPDSGAVVLNAARALRRSGALEADWAPEPIAAAELGRRAPSAWLRMNPQGAAALYSPPYSAVYCAPPGPEAEPAIAGATRIFGTSPGLVKQLRQLARPGQSVTLWRPALSAGIWRDFQPVAGLNTKPRVLWVDEGNAPGWFILNTTIGIWLSLHRESAVLSMTFKPIFKARI